MKLNIPKSILYALRDKPTTIYMKLSEWADPDEETDEVVGQITTDMEVAAYGACVEGGIPFKDQPICHYVTTSTYETNPEMPDCCAVIGFPLLGVGVGDYVVNCKEGVAQCIGAALADTQAMSGTEYVAIVNMADSIDCTEDDFDMVIPEGMGEEECQKIFRLWAAEYLLRQPCDEYDEFDEFDEFYDDDDDDDEDDDYYGEEYGHRALFWKRLNEYMKDEPAESYIEIVKFVDDVLETMNLSAKQPADSKEMKKRLATREMKRAFRDWIIENDAGADNCAGLNKFDEYIGANAPDSTKESMVDVVASIIRSRLNI